MIVQYVVLTLAWIGCAFVVTAAIGVVRMPDLFSRLQASSKAPAPAIALVLIAAVIRIADMAVAVRALALLVLVFVTSPIAAHLIARAGFVTHVQLEAGTRVEDETTS